MNILRTLTHQILKAGERRQSLNLPFFAMSAGDPSSKDDRTRLREHFAASNTPGRWDELWSAGTFLPWDRGTPNPALIDVLSTKSEILGPALVTDENGKTRRRRALVPGCGKGYDVFLFAAFGYDAYGLEGSKNAVKACEGFRGEAETKEEYKIRDESAGRGEVKFVLGDFFAKDWERDTDGNQFDVIYDYTVGALISALSTRLIPDKVPLRPRAKIKVFLVSTHARSPRSKGQPHMP
jgi:SAM-dependent methyltransferase